MVSIPPPACRHPAPDRKRSSGMARVFDADQRRARRSGVDPSTVVLHGRTILELMLRPRPRTSLSSLFRRARGSRTETSKATRFHSFLASRAGAARRALGATRPDKAQRPSSHGHGARRTAQSALQRAARRARASSGRSASEHGNTSDGTCPAERNSRADGSGGRGRGARRARRRRRGARVVPAHAGYTCMNQLGSSASGSAVARTASIASISSFVCTPLRRMAAGPSPAGTTTDSTASAVSTP